LRNGAGMTLSPPGGADDRGVMDLLIAVRTAAAVRWRAHRQLWDAVLSRDPWQPRPSGEGQPLHWEGHTLVGTVLPGRTC
jgi:hypothetical protein